MFPIFIKNFFCLFKRINKVFFPKNNINCEKKDLTYVVFCKAEKKNKLVRQVVS